MGYYILHNPKVVISRIAKYSYGIRAYRAFQKGDPEDKKVNEEGKLWCKNSFKTLFTIKNPPTITIAGGIGPQFLLSKTFSKWDIIFSVVSVKNSLKM
jgi:hypothetical protein